MTLEEIFQAALDKPDAASREAYLAKACSDAKTRHRVEDLLAAHFRSGEFLESQDGTELRDGSTLDKTELRAESTDDRTVTLAGDASPSSKHSKEAESLHFLAPTKRPDSLGRLGHYEVLQVLGKGGFGIVFRAFDDVLQRVVAVKVMAPQIATTSPARKRFLREARSSAAVRHENVVQVYEVVEQPLPYLVMEFIPGETLQDKLNRTGPLEVNEIVRIGRQIAEGLAAAHATDLIHRDIKPGNVLIESGAQHRVKITDFGLARAADDASISQSGIIAGTPMYMAPEQAKGETLDQRADLFSLGSVLYQMAAGRPPFRANSTVAVLKRVAEETPRAIREIIPETPQWLCDIISKLHAKNPDERYQSAREVADVLADCEMQLNRGSKLKDFSRIPREKPATVKSSGRLKWAAATALLLPVITLAVTEFAGVTHLFRGQQATTDPIKPGGDATPIQLTKLEPPPLAVAPFDSTKAKDHQEAWAKHLGLDVRKRGPLDMTLVLIPPGTFYQGTSHDEAKQLEAEMKAKGMPQIWIDALAWETPKRFVRLSTPIQLTANEITIAQFRQFVSESGYKTDAERDGKGGIVLDDKAKRRQDPKWVWSCPGEWNIEEGQPVVQVSWNDAQAFCRWLGEKIGRPCRLPTEAEWEFACRAGGNSRYSSGYDPIQQSENAVYHSRKPEPVGRRKPNPFGLYDMEGNAWEWCADQFSYYRGGTATENPKGRDSGIVRAVRGGGFTSWELAVRPATRWPYLETDREENIGFRVVFEIGGDEQMPPTFKNGIGMEFVIVPKGKSWLGGGKDKMGDKEVEIPADFYLGKYEVTQEEWEKVMGENPSLFSRGGARMDAVTDIPDGDLKRFPVENVSWDQCQIFLEKLNRLQKEAGWVYRLPTQVEWAYACRGGPMVDKLDSAFDFYFAKPTNTLSPNQANYGGDKGLNRTSKVGQYEANRLGLFDMHGNVWEWCDDIREVNGGGSHRVQLGGGWNGALWRSSASNLTLELPSRRSGNLGLRVARVKSGPTSPEANPGTGDKWVRLFNGKDLTGWQAHPATTSAAWKVESGELVGAGEVSYLFNRTAEYDNFHLRTEFQVNKAGNSGVYIRSPFPKVDEGPHPKGYEAQIIGPDATQSNYQTGSLVNFTEAKGTRIDADTWYRLESVAEGNRLQVKLNDVTFTDVRDGKNQFVKGNIALQLWEPGTAVRFRKIEIKELPASSLLPTFTNGIGMEFVKVPKGKSWLGGGKDKPGDKEVEIPADFYLGKYEVTQEEWQKVMGENHSHFSRTGGGKNEVKDISDADLKRFPVESVSWDQCQLFIAKLNQMEKETGWVYRLPTAMEWEYASRGGPMADKLDSAFDFHLSKPTNTLLPTQANFNNGLDRPCKVGLYEPNRLGVFDMHGNVYEWCGDTRKEADEALQRKVFEEPNRELLRVHLGGSWNHDSTYSRSAHLVSGHPSQKSNFLGLRLVRVPVGAPSPEAKTPPVAVTSFTDADVKRIAALPAAEQVEEVRKELVRRNPGFDGKVEHKIEGGVVTGLKFSTAVVDDVTPLRALQGLTSLDFGGNFTSKGKLSDLAPLKGLRLTRLDLSFTKVRDLAPLEGMPLTGLSLGYTQVRDFTPLKGMKLKLLEAQAVPASDLTPLEGVPLEHLDLHRVVGVTDIRPLRDMPLQYLNLSHLTVSDLSPLKGLKSLDRLPLHDMKELSDLKPLEGLKLEVLDLLRTVVTDLSPLKGMELKQIVLPPVKGITQGLDLLREMKSLTTIGIDHGKLLPAAEFWERYDKGEFKE